MEDKKSYLEKLAAQLQQWDKDIDALKIKADKAKAEAKIEILKQIDELRAQKQTAQSRLTELQAAGDEAWDELKAGAEKSWTELKGAFKTALSKFNKT
jgi:hypothetical protein